MWVQFPPGTSIFCNNDRKNSLLHFYFVYRVNDADGTEHQKSEGYTTLKEAEKRKKEIEYKKSLGTFVVPKCTKVKELIKEYVRIYGHNEWGVATYDGNIGLINNYIVRRHIVGEANRTLFSVDLPPRLCRTGT